MPREIADHDATTADALKSLHSGLTVDMIMTLRGNLATCAHDCSLSEAMERNTEGYDHLPVINKSGEREPIIGLLHATSFRAKPIPAGTVSSHMEPLSDDALIGAGSSILDFIVSGDTRPCRLVVSDEGIGGLVSLSDVQKLPVRAALFALITDLEISMTMAIRTKFENGNGWIYCLNEGRQQKICELVEKSKRNDAFVDELLLAQITDKVDIIRALKSDFGIDWTNTFFHKNKERIRKLRDALAHANEYAATVDQAKDLCSVVREIVYLRGVVSNCVFQHSPA